MQRPQWFSILPTLCLVACLLTLAWVSPWLWDIPSKLAKAVDSTPSEQSVVFQCNDAYAEFGPHAAENVASKDSRVFAPAERETMAMRQTAATEASPADSQPEAAEFVTAQDEAPRPAMSSQNAANPLELVFPSDLLGQSYGPNALFYVLREKTPAGEYFAIERNEKQWAALNLVFNWRQQTFEIANAATPVQNLFAEQPEICPKGDRFIEQQPIAAAPQVGNSTPSSEVVVSDEAVAAWPARQRSAFKESQPARNSSTNGTELTQPKLFVAQAGRKMEPTTVAIMPEPQTAASKLPSATESLAAIPAKPYGADLAYVAESQWRKPEVLLETLNALNANRGPAGAWAAEALREIHEFETAIDVGPKEMDAALVRLSKLNGVAQQQAIRLSDTSQTRQWRRAGYALSRHVEVWQCAAPLLKQRLNNALPTVDAKKLNDHLSAIAAYTGDSPTGRAWREYLLYDAVKDQLVKTNRSAANDAELRRLAARVVVRLTQLPMSVEQRKYLAADQVTDYLAEMRRLSYEPVSVGRLLQDIERLERTHLMSDARRVASDYQSMSMSPDATERRLAECVDMHYRNANVRFAFTEKLANSLIPEQKVQYGVINDTVGGRPTQGETEMRTELSIEMMPDDHRACFALVAQGEISATTQTDAGPARFHSNTDTRFIARKPVEINMSGILLSQVEVGVENDTQLAGVETVARRVPALGLLTESIAVQQYEQNKPAANEEAKQKVTIEVARRVNAETHERFKDVVERLNQQVFDPLNSLALDPLLIDAKTTKERVTMRLRVSGEDQLGSFTPRPEAPSDSLASVQFHESVINNAIQRLGLDGQTFMLPDLNKHIATSFGRPAPEVNHDNDDVKITFAPKDAITVRCQEGQVAITVSVVKLSKSSRHWNNFQVRAFYQPEVDGRSARLSREGVIRLLGPRLSVGSQIALRGIFSHTFSKKAPWELVPEQVMNQPKLKDTVITQFVIEDGWVGIALGPKMATARRVMTNIR